MHLIGDMAELPSAKLGEEKQYYTFKASCAPFSLITAGLAARVKVQC